MRKLKPRAVKRFAQDLAHLSALFGPSPLSCLQAQESEADIFSFRAGNVPTTCGKMIGASGPQESQCPQLEDRGL